MVDAILVQLDLILALNKFIIYICMYKCMSQMLQVHCRTNSSVGKSVGMESRRLWVKVPLGPTSLTPKLSNEVLYVCSIIYIPQC